MAKMEFCILLLVALCLKLLIQAWPLPPTEQEMADGTERFKWFGRFVQSSSVVPSNLKTNFYTFPGKIICAKLSSPRFILEGVVAPELQKFSTSLLSNPLIMVKSWSNLQVRIGLHLCS